MNGEGLSTSELDLPNYSFGWLEVLPLGDLLPPVDDLHQRVLYFAAKVCT